MEAEIYCRESLTKKSKSPITDIDVLALCPTEYGRLDMIISDCKTLKNASPISRALWLKGLMVLLRADNGFVLLDKLIEPEHKLTAFDIGVNLISIQDFEKYAMCTCKEYKTMNSSIANLESWEQYYNLSNRFPALKIGIDYVKNSFWNIRDCRVQLRHTLYIIRELKKELDPSQNIHITLFTDLVALFSISLSQTVREIFNQYLQPETKEHLSNDLKMFIWGGIDYYKYMDNLYSKVSGDKQDMLVLPEWSLFIQLVRQCLEAPYDTSHVPLILREVAFEYFERETLFGTNFSRTLVNENLQAAKFAILINDYVCKATQIPPEFKSILEKRLLDIQV